MTKIVVDAMGSDNYPTPDVEGAVMAARDYGVEILLVGDTAQIKPVLDALQATYTKVAESVEVRRRALEALAYHTFDALPELIRSAYNDSHEPLRVSAVQAMGRSADEQWVKIVLAELHSTNPEMRFEAAQACGMLEIPMAVKPLTQLVDDVDDQVQRMAIWSLGQIGGDAARQVILHVLDGDQAYLHDAADDALAELEFKSGNIDLKLLDIEDPDADEDDDEDWLLEFIDEENMDEDEEEVTDRENEDDVEEEVTDSEDDDLAQEE